MKTKAAMIVSIAMISAVVGFISWLIDVFGRTLGQGG